VGELFVKYYTKGVNVKKRLYTKEGELQTCLIIMKEKYLILLWGGFWKRRTTVCNNITSWH
jgi:hypothetical protein